MKGYTLKRLFRSIKGSLGRYLAIMSIVALGVGFYSGLECSEPAMRQTADVYMDQTGMYDFRFLSSLGFTEENVGIVENSGKVEKAEGSFFSEALAVTGDKVEVPLMFFSLTEKVAVPVLSAGRMPENAGECLGDKNLFTEEDIGKTVKISSSNEEDVLDLFSEKEYVITGLAGSPRYISIDRGTTSLGSGKLEGFVVLLPEAFDGDVYHELLVDCGISDAFTDAYQVRADELEPELENLLDSVAGERYKKLRKEADDELADARKELDDGWKEYEDGKAEAEQKLADGREEIESAREDLKAAESRLISNRQQIDDAMDQLSDAEKNLEEQQTLLDGNAAQIEAALTQINEAIAGIQNNPDLGEEERAATLAGLEAQKAELEAGKAEVESGQAGLDAAKEQLNDNRKQLEDGLDQISYGWSKVKDGYAELEEAEEDLKEAELEAEEELADALKELEDGEKEYADGVSEAEENLKLETYCLGRESNSGCATYKNDIAIISAAAKAFPIFFVLIAALVCVTTMTRMVNEERTQIGTLKALGFSAARTASKYILYAGSAAFFGCAFGLAAGMTVIPYVVWYAYTMLYNYAPVRLYFSPAIVAASFAVSVTGIMAVTALACKRELKEKPAELIRPKAPAEGKRILLEKIKFLWKHFSFLTKVMLRNAFRRPVRVIMMIVGIGGCTALMIAGFGVNDSIAGVMDYQYGEVFLYDITVSYDPDTCTTAEEAEEVWADYCQESAVIAQYEAEITAADGKSRSVKLRAADEKEYEGVINFCNDGIPVDYPEPGEVMLTTGIADILKLSIGDKVTLTGDDFLPVELIVCGISDNYADRYIYGNPADFKELVPNTGLLTAGENALSAAAAIRAKDGISYVSCAVDEMDTMEKSVSSISLILIVVFVCSAALAFITVFNLTNINIMERVREIATVKVLGFWRKETAAYVLKENLLLSLLGAAAGLPMGKLLHRFIMELIKVENMTYDIRILPRSYAIGFAATVVFVILINRLMYSHLDSVNMAESLKSVE